MILREFKNKKILIEIILQSGTEMLPEHAGFLMALGLNGHLKNLKRMNMFEYLSRHHEMTNVALLIGLSATFRGIFALKLSN